MNLDDGIEIVHTADIPARSGIGSSSAFTVGLLHSVNAYQGRIISKKMLAEKAIFVEQKMIKENVGSQDQIACAFGGLNKIEFFKHEDCNFVVSPITLDRSKLDFLQSHLLLFYTGISRNASDIAGRKISNLEKKFGSIKVLEDLVDEGIDILSGRLEDMDDFGKLLDQSWTIKQNIADGVTTDIIDEAYNAALRAGAIGGKLLGAGGGGFLLFFVRPEIQDKVKSVLSHMVEVPFKFELSGSHIIHYSD